MDIQELNELKDLSKYSTDSKKYITFKIDDYLYCIDIADVHEIISLHKFIRVPKVPKYIKGIINLRGEIIPVIDMRLKFGKSEIEYDSSSSIIIIKSNDIILGLLVDKVEEVLEIQDKLIIAPPEYKNSKESQYITGLCKKDNEIKYILSSETIINTDEL